MKKIIEYNMWKLWKFLMWRDDGENAYFVLKRDIFDKLWDDEIVKFKLKKWVIMNPSFADETIARLIKEYPWKVFVDKNVEAPVKKIFETIELTTDIKVEYI